MKLFCTSQISQIDKYTIKHEPIADIDLMERAASTVFQFIKNTLDKPHEAYVFCGPGNNGGDGLAIARMLANGLCQKVWVYVLTFGKPLAGSPKINFDRLTQTDKVHIEFIGEQTTLPQIPEQAFIVDALFGSGLSRPLDGLPAKIVEHINVLKAPIFAVDIPSGLMGEDNTGNTGSIVKADYTLTFQFPKISFLFAENEKYTGLWQVSDIGLHQSAIEKTQSKYSLLTDSIVRLLLKPRAKFSHKGTFGHALLIAGAYGKMGAAVLAAKACLRSGVGLLTVHVPHSAVHVIHTAVAEAMVSIDDSDLMFTEVKNPDDYTNVAVGPGIGQKVNTVRALEKLFANTHNPIVIDADAINIIAANKQLLKLVPQNSIFTPHPKEFERLAGKSQNGYEQMQKAIDFAVDNNVIVVLKGAHTLIVNSSGEVCWNTTGNAGMATAGSGDTLTGIVLGLLASGYMPFDAARIGVYIHGLAGDLAAKKMGHEALIASDITRYLGKAFKVLHVLQ